MKKISIIIIVFALFACNKQEEKPDYVIISGNVANSVESEIFLRGDRYMGFKKTVKLNEDGIFKDTVRLDKWNRNYIIWIQYQPITFYAQKGDHIIINVDTTKTNNPVSFKGSRALINNYILAKEKVESDLISKNQNVYSLDENNFIQKIKEIKDAHIEFLEKTKGLQNKFRKQEEKDLEYTYYAKMGSYELFHGRAIKNPGFKISEHFLDDYHTVDFENEVMFQKSFHYEDLVMGRLRAINNEQIRKNKEEGISYDSRMVRLKTYCEITENSRIREYILNNDMKNYMRSRADAERKTNAFNYYMENTANEEFKKEVKDIFDKSKRLWRGNPSPKFVEYRNHAGGTTSLDDLKGKFVYVDVWATWCSPCKYEMPHLKKLEASYRGKNIEFVSISIDRERDYGKWEQMVIDMELAGIQLFADQSNSSEFIKNYNIYSIPRFILIDPEGKIVSQGAPRPSTDDLRELFNEMEI